MKKLSFILVVALLSFIQAPPEYKVYKIVPVDGIFLIYAKNQDGRIFKIVSKKQKLKNCNNIKIGCSYPFDLHSRFEGEYTGRLAGLRNRRNPDISGYDFYGVVVKLEGDSVNDLFTAANIKGLCLVK